MAERFREARWYIDLSHHTLVKTKPGRYREGIMSDVDFEIDLHEANITSLIHALEEGGYLAPRVDHKMRAEDLKVIHRLIDLTERQAEIIGQSHKAAGQDVDLADQGVPKKIVTSDAGHVPVQSNVLTVRDSGTREIRSNERNSESGLAPDALPPVGQGGLRSPVDEPEAGEELFFVYVWPDGGLGRYSSPIPLYVRAFNHNEVTIIVEREYPGHSIEILDTAKLTQIAKELQNPAIEPDLGATGWKERR